MDDFVIRLFRIIGFLLLGVFCLISEYVSPVVAARASDKPEIILSASEINYPPFCLIDSNHNADGFSVDLLRSALQAMGREVSFDVDVWTKVKQSLIERKIQVLPLVGRTPERESVFDFTFPYMTMHGSIVVRRDTSNIRSMVDLVGKQVAVMEGDNAEEFLRRDHLDIEIVTVAIFDQALLDLAAGANDAVVMQKLLAIQLIKKHNIRNLQIASSPFWL